MKITILLLVALTGILHAQGPLDPLAGPAPTMKSLDQIEPRTPISSLPYTISESGSYYFTGNLVFTGNTGSAITVFASNVTLDLMGFTLSSTSSVTGNGIHVTANAKNNVRIQNGNVEGRTTVTQSGSPSTWSVVPGGFEYGVRSFGSNTSFKNLAISGARLDGLLSLVACTIDNVRSTQNGGRGIHASSNSVVTNSIASFNGTIGISAPSGSVSNSTARFNGGDGISVIGGSVSNSTTESNGANGITADYGNVSNSIAKSNASYGIYALSGNVSSSTGRANASDGIYAHSGSISHSTARFNDGSGISAFNGNVSNCSVSNNSSDGIYASTGSVSNSVASSNGSFDISASNAVVAFCRFTTFLMSGSSRTGNFPSP